MILVATGIFHVGVYALLDGGWDGPVSWRKPIEFGISGGILVAVVSLGIMAMTVWTFVSLRGPGATRLAIRAGMVFLTIGQFLGFAIVTNGLGVDDLSRASIFGAAGEMKVPHGWPFTPCRCSESSR